MRIARFPLLAGVAALAVTGGVALTGGRGHTATAQQQTESVELFAVCNNVSLTWATGTPLTQIVQGVTPQSAIRSVWRFNNVEQKFVGFSPQFPDASDFRTANRLDPVFLCMNAPGTLNRPLIP